MARALYRTYRSRSLDEVVGQEHITDLLKRSLSSGRISHAYLFTGPRGTGKTSVARIMAHEINGLAYSDDPNLDIIEIDAASNRRIDDVRELREKVHIAPLNTKYKVYIIDEVHMLTTESFNALLKTLEEPPEHVIFILATTDVHKVPATILSRTQRFHFRLGAPEVITKHLRAIADKEHIDIDEAALALIARHGGGSFRDSVGLLDQVSASGEQITAEVVERALGLAPGDQMTALVHAVIERRTSEVLDLLRTLDESGVSATVAAEQLIRALSESAAKTPRLFAVVDRLLEVSKAQHPFIKLTAILVSYTEGSSTQESAPKVVAAAVAPAKSVVAKPAPTPRSVDPASTTTEESAPADAPAPSTLKATTPPDGHFDWSKVLATLKSHHPALHSVVVRATIDCDGHTLNLSFPYALHRKKLEQPQYRAQLMRVIEDTCGTTLELVIGQASPALSEEANQVAAIMGGGEPVNAI